MSRGVPTIFVVDDEPSVRKALTRLLTSAGYPVQAFDSASLFLQHLPHQGLGCLVLDLRMPDLNGLELQQTLASSHSTLPIIFISGHGDIPSSVRAMKAGAVDFLQKPFSDTELLAAIDSALQKCRRELKQRLEIAETKSRLSTLTPRESQVLAGVIAGKLNKQIAADLGTVEKTVKVHRSRVMQKMQVRSVAELVRLAERAGVQAADSH